MRFEFATATQILFGEGTRAELGAAAAKLGQRALVVGGSRQSRIQTQIDNLTAAGAITTFLPISGEPSIATVVGGVDAARTNGCALIVAIGGGSAIDAGKAIAALVANGGEPLDYLEVVGRGQPLAVPSLPVIAVPTTAGTGAEVTRNAVLAVPERRVKVSLRSATMLPRLAIVDPELTYTMPGDITASTGLDALTQCLEPYVSIFANPVTDSLARHGIVCAQRSLVQAVGNQPEARRDMALASLLGGMALANARLGAVHGLAGVIGGIFPIAHGVICARLLPFVTQVNVRALRARQPNSPALDRYRETARLFTGDSQADAEEIAASLIQLATTLNIPRLGDFGLRAADHPEIIAKTQKSSSMKGNPLPLTDDELAEILEQA
jgi:alcohol dehydrogenase class IV